MTSGRRFAQLSAAKVVIVLFFAVALLVVALPSYLGGRLPSASTIDPVELKAMNQIRTDGLTLDGWENREVEEFTIGGYTWLQQIVSGAADTPQADRGALLFIHPQKSATGTSSLPQTEWSDLESLLTRPDGSQLDSWGWLSFDAIGQTGIIKARFYRVVTGQQTYAALSWYDWSVAGHYSVARWFLADLQAQVAGTRRPWVAVTLLAPIEPRGNIDDAREFVLSLAQATHQGLQTAGLAEAAPQPQ